MIDRTDFASEMEKKLDDFNAEILKFRIIAEVAEPDAQIVHYQIIEDLVEKETAIKGNLAVFNESGAVDRSELKSEIVHLQQQLEDAIEAARITIN